MKIYSDFAGRRTAQIAFDVIAFVMIAAWIWLGVVLYTLVMDLAVFGRQLEDAGAGFRETMIDVGENLGGVPFIGEGIRIPFDGASSAGQALQDAGQSQQDAVQALALGLGVGIAALPTLTILLLWLVPRIRFARKAGTARSLVNGGVGIDLLALRALSSQNLAVLSRLDADPVAAWRRGDEGVIRQLAQLELRSSGVRLSQEASGG